MLALIDADIVAFRCAASAENEPREIALLRADNSMREILKACDSDEYKAFLSGANNFRYSLYPDYKGNRKGKPEPRHRDAVKEFLVKEWSAIVTDGCEADDMLGVEQSLINSVNHSMMLSGKQVNDPSVICTIDKDLRQVPGHHYNWVKDEHSHVEKQQAMFNFYSQLVLGDKADNIPGFDLKMRPEIPKFLMHVFDDLNNCETELEMFTRVWDLYDSENHVSDMKLNGQLLYIWRKDNDNWQPTYDKLYSEMVLQQ